MKKLKTFPAIFVLVLFITACSTVALTGRKTTSFSIGLRSVEFK